jgi:hypothetical protein
MRRPFLGWLLVGSVVMRADATKLNLMANPIRKVVTMMQKMQTQVEHDGKVKEDMYDKFMCYCKNGGSSLSSSIEAAEEKIPQLESSIKENKGAHAQIEADLKSSYDDRKEATDTLAKAKAIRAKEAKEYAAEKTETESNIAALEKAIPAIEKGLGASFIQTNTGMADRLRQLSVSMDMESADRDLLASFLADGSTSKGSGSSEILGILKEMHDEMNKDLDDLNAQEESSIADYESLVAAKNKQRAALTKGIETKEVRKGQLAVKLTETENDLEDTSEQLAEDKKMLANLDTQCKVKKQEWESYRKMMAQEHVALAETIKLLNDDDALGLFKKTLPSASSFMQVGMTTKMLKRKALQVLKSAKKHRHHKDPRIDFLEMALHGNQVGFDKVMEMVDGLMGTLKKEQGDDDRKKGYCLQEFDKYEDMAKGLALDQSDLKKAIADGEETLKTLQKEIVDLTQGIRDLDKSVAESTESRKEENAEFQRVSAENNAAMELLEMAKNRLNKFYNPKLHEAAPNQEVLVQEDASVDNEDGTAPSFVQTEAQRHRFRRHRHHRQPEGNLDYKKKEEESNGVMAMIGILIGDVTKDGQVLELEEKDAQKEYEEFMADAKHKRSLDAKTITDKEGSKAAAEASTEENKMSLKQKNTEMMETKKYIAGLHSECDWLLKFYDTRKQARTEEIESLDKAKSVLSGADYSFLQIASSHLRGSK